MSERERWIVYPLIFFALGAAVRDKILQRVEVKEIICESVKIVDLQNPTIELAVLGFQRAPSNDPTQLADRGAACGSSIAMATKCATSKAMCTFTACGPICCR